MKNILFVHQTSSIGGGSLCLINLIKGLDRTAYTPIVLLREDGPLKNNLEDLGIEVLIYSKLCGTPYNMPFLSFTSLYSYGQVLSSLNGFKKILSRKNIDILYLNNMMLYPYLKIAKEVDVKSVIHIREHWPIEEHRIQLSWIQNIVYKYADRVLAINTYSASLFPRIQNDITIVYDWIDMSSRYGRTSMNDVFNENCENLKIYLFTGGFTPIKGGINVVESFSRDIIDKNSRLLILGEAPIVNYKGLKGKVKYIFNQIRKVFGIEPYHVSMHKKVQLDSRIKCIPSTFYISEIIEQSYCVLSYFTIPHANLALAESLILGTPVVAAQTDESMEYSNNGELAILFNINDENDFSRSLSEVEHFMKEHPNLKAEAEVIKNLFSPSRNVEKVNIVLSSLS